MRIIYWDFGRRTVRKRYQIPKIGKNENLFENPKRMIFSRCTEVSADHWQGIMIQKFGGWRTQKNWWNRQEKSVPVFISASRGSWYVTESSASTSGARQLRVRCSQCVYEYGHESNLENRAKNTERRRCRSDSCIAHCIMILMRGNLLTSDCSGAKKGRRFPKSLTKKWQWSIFLMRGRDGIRKRKTFFPLFRTRYCILDIGHILQRATCTQPCSLTETFCLRNYLQLSTILTEAGGTKGSCYFRQYRTTMLGTLLAAIWAEFITVLGRTIVRNLLRPTPYRFFSSDESVS